MSPLPSKNRAYNDLLDHKLQSHMPRVWSLIWSSLRSQLVTLSSPLAFHGDRSDTILTALLDPCSDCLVSRQTSAMLWRDGVQGERRCSYIMKNDEHQSTFRVMIGTNPLYRAAGPSLATMEVMA